MSAHRYRFGMRRRAGAHGLSLVEVVIALAIFSLISGLFYSALWMGQTQMLRLARPDQSADQLLQARRFFQSAVDGLTVIGLPPTGRAPLVEGGPDRLTFLAMTPGDYGGGRVLRHTFTIAQTDGPAGLTSTLSVTRQPADGDEGTQTAVMWRVRGPLSFRFAGRNGAGEMAWDDSWAELLRIPVHIAVTDESGVVFMATPKIDRDLRCIQRRGDRGLAGTDCGVK